MAFRTTPPNNQLTIGCTPGNSVPMVFSWCSLGVRWDRGTSNCPQSLKHKDPNKQLGRIANSVAKPSIVMWKLVPSMVICGPKLWRLISLAFFWKNRRACPNIATKTHAKGLVHTLQKKYGRRDGSSSQSTSLDGFEVDVSPFPRMYFQIPCYPKNPDPSKVAILRTRTPAI